MIQRALDTLKIVYENPGKAYPYRLPASLSRKSQAGDIDFGEPPDLRDLQLLLRL